MRVAGIPIGVDAGWLIAVVVVSWSLAESFMPERLPGQGARTYWTLGILGALLLFLSVLLHELGHALVARRLGVEVEGITLMLFGGVARLRSEPNRARDELLIAILGPIVSLAIGLGSFAVAQVSGGAIGAMAHYLALSNGLFAAFNVLPGFPLDGGRVLRAVVWGLTGNLVQATNLAASVGQGFALLLMVFGLIQLVTGSFGNGIWIGFIGWYLFGAASSSRQATRAHVGLGGVRVADVMDTSPPTVSPTVSIDAFVREQIIREGLRSAVIVVGEKPWGIVTLSDLRRVAPEEWSSTPISQVATRPPLVALPPTAPAEEALRLLAEHGIAQVLVLGEHDRLLGVVSRNAIFNVLQLQQEAPGLFPGRGRAPLP